MKRRRRFTGMTSPSIFVFGSNEVGRHGAGAALYAREHHGAIYGQGYGLQGQSFAVPTKGQDNAGRLYSLTLPTIAAYVARFLDFARQRQDLRFNVTRLGCGRAGYKDWQIAPMFRDAPANCRLPEDWLPFTRPNTDDEQPLATATTAAAPLATLRMGELAEDTGN
jgi:hypothetical protein